MEQGPDEVTTADDEKERAERLRETTEKPLNEQGGDGDASSGDAAAGTERSS